MCLGFGLVWFLVCFGFVCFGLVLGCFGFVGFLLVCLFEKIHFCNDLMKL